jgi:hypothetical protein
MLGTRGDGAGDTCSCRSEDAAFLFGVGGGELGGHFVRVVCGRDKEGKFWKFGYQRDNVSHL